MSDKKYFKFDEVNQFLENESDINYFSLNQARRVAVGNMLGDFDENGFYVVDEKIVKQLINMPKIIVESLEDVDLIRGAVKFDNYLHFMLTVSENKASLILLEKINFESNTKYNAGSYSNMNEYVLDEITIPDRDIDKNAIYSKFNIMRADEGKYYDINDFTEEEQQNFSAIMNKMKYNILAQNEMLKAEKPIEIIEADYFDNVLASIKLYPKVYAEFEKLLSNIILEKQEFLQIERPFFQKTINEILDNCLRLLFTKLSVEIREVLEQKIREIKDKYYKELNKVIHFRFITTITNEQTKDSMISEVVGEKKQSSTLLKMKVEEEKLNNSLSSVIDENEKLKKDLVKENSDGKAIKKDNPVLTKFFKDVKADSGVDMLKPDNEKAPAKAEIAPKPAVAKKDTVTAKVSAPQPKVEKINEKTEVKKPVETAQPNRQTTTAPQQTKVASSNTGLIRDLTKNTVSKTGADVSSTKTADATNPSQTTDLNTNSMDFFM